MAVTIISVSPTSQDVTVQWQSDQQAFSSANLYVASTQAGLTNPASRLSASASNPLPDTTFRATLPNLAGGVTPLTAGSQYYCMCDADGLASGSQGFMTLPDDCHLHDPDAYPRIISCNGGVSVISLTVRKSGTVVPGIPVTFTVPNGCDGQMGPVGGSPVGPSYQCNSDVNGIAQAAFTAGATKGEFDIIITATSYATNTQKIRVKIS